MRGIECRWPPTLARPSSVAVSSAPMITPKTSSIVLVAWLFLAVLLVLPGCSGGTEAGPAEQISTLHARLQGGEITAAYDGFLPASYDRDLNGVLDKARQLVGEEEFRRSCAVLERAGKKLAHVVQPLLALGGEATASWKPLAAKLQDLPGALGLKDYAEFRRSSVRELLQGMENGFLKELLKHHHLQQMLGTGVQVTLLERKGNMAELKVKATVDGSFRKEEQVTVENIEGKWVPVEMAFRWQETMASLHKQLDELIAAKKQQPDLLLEQLANLEQLIEEGGDMLPQMLEGLGQAFPGLGGGKPPAEE
jgi:hypothetical protein